MIDGVAEHQQMIDGAEDALRTYVHTKPAAEVVPQPDTPKAS
jgi:hypothetical protein